MAGRTGHIIQATKLREILGTKLWTLSDLSAKAQVSYRTVKYAVSGHPRIYTPAVVNAIAQALDVDAADFSIAVGPDCDLEALIRSVLPDAVFERAS